MNRSTVAVIRCPSYDEDCIGDAVREGINLLGGINEFAAKDETILLKPNVLAGRDPARCISTHPTILKAVGRQLQKRTRSITFGDSPGMGKSADHLAKALLSQAGEEIGLRLADFDRGREINFNTAVSPNTFLIARGVTEANGIISLSKLKTHSLTRMTGAVKNQFGCIPGLAKKGYHFRYPSAFDFSKLLVSLNLCVKPRLHIMDGVWAMEGNGPQGGDPVQMGVLLFSRDPVALDAVMCALVDLNPLYVPTMSPARTLKLGTYRRDEIQIVGDGIAGSVNGDFAVRRGPIRDLTPTGMLAFVNNMIGERPVIHRQRCTRCGECLDACPVDPKALFWPAKRGDLPPAFRYMECIRCFCCQEACPEGAISVRLSVLKLNL